MQVVQFSRILKIYKSCFALQKIKVRQRSTNLVVLKHSRLHTKFQSHPSIGKENFKGFYNIWGCGHLGHATKPIYKNTCSTSHRSFLMLFGFKSSNSFLGKTRHKIGNGVTFREGQIMALTLDIFFAY